MDAADQRVAEEPVHRFPLHEVGLLYFGVGLRVVAVAMAALAVLLPNSDRVNMPLYFRLISVAVMVFLYFIGSAMAPAAVLRVGVARRLVGTQLEMARPFWFRRRIDLRLADGAAGKSPSWQRGSGRYAAGSRYYDWGVVFAHPAGMPRPNDVSPSAMIRRLEQRGYGAPVIEDWVNREQRLIFIDLQNDGALPAVRALGAAIEAGGGRLDPSFDQTLRSVRAVFARNSKNVQAVRSRESNRSWPWRRSG